MRPDTKGWAGGWGSTSARFTVVGTNICPALHKKYSLHQEVRELLHLRTAKRFEVRICSDTNPMLLWIWNVKPVHLARCYFRDERLERVGPVWRLF